MDLTKSAKSTATKLKRIAELSARDPEKKFNGLMPHFNQESLGGCFQRLDGKKAVGVNGQTKEEYGRDLKANLDDLVGRMKRMAYRPDPVREVLIPKEGKKNQFRPLGISNIEDKIVQSMTKEILEKIYDPIFLDCSYGFRPRRGCHDAIQALYRYLFANEVEMVIDVDLENFFGSIDHKVLVSFLKRKTEDNRFLRYVVRMLKAGVLSKGELRMTEEGTPQGSLCSPVLANVVAHYVIDCWFTDVVKEYVRGPVELFRYADDAVICCRFRTDAERIRRALTKRLEKYSLKLNQEKTKLVPFSKNRYRFKGEQQGTFDFLGFSFVLGKSRSGKTIPKVRTSRKRLASKLKRVNAWCKAHRCHVRLKPLWLRFCVKLEGHAQYYGVSFNTEQVRGFIYHATKIFFKWSNRRSQRKSLNWEQFRLFMERFPPPQARVCHPLFPSPRTARIIVSPLRK